MTVANDLAPLAYQPAQTPTRPPAPPRLVSLDAYRGFVMLLMASAGLGIPRVARSFKDSPVWQFLAQQTDHVPWIGCSLWDLIQPSFMFMVGVALPFSIASRLAKGHSFTRMFTHAAFRALLLIWLGIFLSSVGQSRTNFTLVNVLTQIGLGYVFLFLLAWTKPRPQLITAFAILVIYWAAFALWPLSPAGFDYSTVGLAKDWTHLQGFAAHWDKNSNFASSFDQWFLNLFPRDKHFAFNSGGYATLNFIPSLATMILGLLAGQLLRSTRPDALKVIIIALAGLLALAAGWALGAFGFCPIVKRIWTPSWTLFAGGWTLLLLAAFYIAIDLVGFKRLAFPFVVVGANSIAMYCMAQLFGPFITSSFTTHFGPHVFQLPASVYEPLTRSVTILLILWLICLWMHRKRLFVRI